MDMAAAASMITSDLGLDDGGSSFLLSVCLDHQLRIWNLGNGNVLDSTDLLGVKRDDSNEIGKWTVDPSQSNLVRVICEGDGAAVCLTFSPIGTGEFKFWQILAQGQDNVKISDLFPNIHLVPQPPSNDIWTVADFAVNYAIGDGYYIWVLWKNNMNHRVQRIHVPSEIHSQIDSSDVVDVFTDSTIQPAEAATPCEPADSTEKWLELIFYPGRFTKATLETALSIYERGLGTAKEPSKSGRNIAEKICHALSQTISLDRGLEGRMDYGQFRQATEVEWRRFYRLLLELDKQRGEALSLVLDPHCSLHSGIVWVVCADLVSFVRECDGLDRVVHSISAPPANLAEVSKLVATGQAFVEGFSDGMLQICNSVLRAELFREPTRTDMERLQFFSDKTGFWRQLSDEDCAQVADALGSNFNRVTSQLYGKLFELVSAEEDSRRRTVLLPLTEFGRKMAIKASQDTAETWRMVFFSQLILLVHMAFEFDAEEDALHQRLDVGKVYKMIIAVLKRLELIRWLAGTEISVPLSKPDGKRWDSTTSSPVASRGAASKEDMQVITALEGHVGHLLGLPESKKLNPFANSITDVVASLLVHDSDIELVPALIQCSLLKRERVDLALELQPFAGADPFATYVQGRVFLATKDLETAAQYFSKAAVGMSRTFPWSICSVDWLDGITSEILTMSTLGGPNPGDRHSSGLLNDFDWSLLHAGPARYYIHIVSLFDAARAYSYVITFSRLALQFSPSAQERTELLNRIFASATSMSHFETAHNALVEMALVASPASSSSSSSSSLPPSSPPPLLLSCLRRLVGTMCTQQAAAELISLPFVGLLEYIDAELEARATASSGQEGGTPFHDILYAFRIRRGDYRGAATVLYDRIRKIKRNETDRMPAPPEMGADVLDTNVTRLYLILINAMACLGGDGGNGDGNAKTGWIMVEGDEHGGELEDCDDNDDNAGANSTFAGSVTTSFSTAPGTAPGTVVGTTSSSFASTAASSTAAQNKKKKQQHGKNKKRGGRRRVLTLADVRREYQDELDRIAVIQNDQFGFGLEDDDNGMTDKGRPAHEKDGDGGVSMNVL